MRSYIVIATKGRAETAATLLDHLELQTKTSDLVVIVGVETADIAGLSDHQLTIDGRAQVLLSNQAGLPIQRNFGLAHLDRLGAFGAQEPPSFVAFFDDDFRPAANWIESAAQMFAVHADVVALTGHVLADGITGFGLSEANASAYLKGDLKPTPHWASGPEERSVSSMYGCNMAFRDVVVRSCRFDERLPLYAWQEDRDYTGQAQKFGRTIYTPACRGVHLGIKSARQSGVRFGYSQIANPIYLAGKGTMQRKHMRRFLWRALAANLLRSFRTHPTVDFRGRLRGNLRAVFDFLNGRCAPERILDL